MGEAEVVDKMTMDVQEDAAGRPERFVPKPPPGLSHGALLLWQKTVRDLKQAIRLTPGEYLLIARVCRVYDELSAATDNPHADSERVRKLERRYTHLLSELRRIKKGGLAEKRMKSKDAAPSNKNVRVVDHLLRRAE